MKKSFLSMLLLLGSSQHAFANPITLLIPKAYADTIDKKNYVVPDLKSNPQLSTLAVSNHESVSIPKINTPSRVVSHKPVKKLGFREQKALAMSEHYQESTPLLVQGEQGKVTFVYGQTQPVIVCAVMRVCLLELEADEKIQDQFVGDTMRWEVLPSNTSQPHIIIKPKQPNVETNYVILTNKRKYMLTLKSSSTRYMSMVNFSYPESQNEKWNQYYAAQNLKNKLEEKKQANQSYVLQAQKLDFNYVVDGKAKFKPTRVYTDGIKTYIELPNTLKSGEIPIFMAQTKGQKSKVVNMRFLDGKYIIDQKIDQGYLMAGSGKYAEKITIIYGKAYVHSPNHMDDYKG